MVTNLWELFQIFLLCILRWVGEWGARLQVNSKFLVYWVTPASRDKAKSPILAGGTLSWHCQQFASNLIYVRNFNHILQDFKQLLPRFRKFSQFRHFAFWIIFVILFLRNFTLIFLTVQSIFPVLIHTQFLKYFKEFINLSKFNKIFNFHNFGHISVNFEENLSPKNIKMA